MGSRVMHFIVSLKVAKQIKCREMNQFLRGGIAPDAVVNKESSYFYADNVATYIRYIDYTTF